MPPKSTFPSTPTPVLKRKRDISDEMNRNTREAETQTVDSPSFFARLTPIVNKSLDFGKSLFGTVVRVWNTPPPKAITAPGSVPSQHSEHKRRVIEFHRERTVPGAFPFSPDGFSFPDLQDISRASSVAPEIRPTKKAISQPPKPIPSGTRERVSQQVKIRPLPDLGLPSSTPPPIHRPRHVTVYGLNEQKALILQQRRANAQNRRHTSTYFTPKRDIQGTTRGWPRPSSSSRSTSKRIQKSPAKSQKTSVAQTDAEPSNSVLDILASEKLDISEALEDLKLKAYEKSAKLQEREEELQRRKREEELQRRKRAPSPGLLNHLEKATEEYLEIKEAAEKEKAKPLKPLPPPPPFIRLPSQQSIAKIPNLSKCSPHTELQVYGKTPVKPHDFDSVRPNVWLNDSILNAWFDDLCRRSRDKLNSSLPSPITDPTPRYHYFNTQWYPTATGSGGIAKVSRWAARAKLNGANLLKAHKILIPCHVNGSHWTLLSIFPQRRLVRYYDSLGWSATSALNAAKAWIQHELTSANAWDESEWTFEVAVSSRQQNGADCGVFASFNALATFYAENPSEIIPSVEMSTARELMRVVLLTGGFEDEFDLEKWYPGFRLETDRAVAATNGTEA